MNVVWLISVPKNHYSTYDLEHKKSVQKYLSHICQFPVPQFKFTKLDQLFSSCDAFETLDVSVERLLCKATSFLSVVLNKERDIKYIPEEFLKVRGLDTGQYVTEFKWDSSKFGANEKLTYIRSVINKHVDRINEDLKIRISDYNETRNADKELKNKISDEKIQSSNLWRFVKREHLILDSEYLTTLFVILPKHLYKDWAKNYETLTPLIIPRSSVLVHEDKKRSQGLFSVTLFKKQVKAFKRIAQRKHYQVCEYTYEENIQETIRTLASNFDKKKRQHVRHLILWLKSIFEILFDIWLHVKTVRIFVESCLRYGFTEFQAMAIYPKKNTKKLLTELNKLYQDLVPEIITKKDSVIPAMKEANDIYSTYVHFNIDVNFNEKRLKLIKF